MKEFNLSVMSPGESLYEGTATSMVVPTLDGYIGILPNHVPLVSVIAPGEIKINKDNEVKKITISGGLIDITPKSVSIVTQ